MIGSMPLIFVPWLDVRKSRHPYKRPLATGGMVLAVVLTIWLTNEAAVQHQAELASANGTAPLSAGLVSLPKISTVANPLGRHHRCGLQNL